MQMLTKLSEILHQHSTPSQNPEYQTELSTETALKVLSETRRRRIIEYLCTQGPDTTVRALSEHLADIEQTDRKTTYIALYQQHLPVLDEAGVIEWNQRSGTVSATSDCTVLYDLQSELLDPFNDT